jgi:hypothetical protein
LTLNRTFGLASQKTKGEVWNFKKIEFQITTTKNQKFIGHKRCKLVKR